MQAVALSETVNRAGLLLLLLYTLLYIQYIPHFTTTTTAATDGQFGEGLATIMPQRESSRAGSDLLAKGKVFTASLADC